MIARNDISLVVQQGLKTLKQRLFSLMLRQFAVMGHKFGINLGTLLVVVVITCLVLILDHYHELKADTDVNNIIALQQMDEIRTALLKFKMDSGTDDFPGYGSYSCTDPQNPNKRNPLMTFPYEAGKTDQQVIAWCQHPANFWMLYSSPFPNKWNREAKKSWHGPYLKRTDAYVNVGQHIHRDGTGRPDQGLLVSMLWGIADPFKNTPSGLYLTWSNLTERKSRFFKTYEKYGAPYLLLDLDKPERARIVSMGADGQYSQLAGICSTVPSVEEKEVDDLALCLFQSN